MFILMGGIELGKGGLLFVRRGWGRWMFFRFGKFLSYAFVRWFLFAWRGFVGLVFRCCFVCRFFRTCSFGRCVMGSDEG